MVPAVPEVHLVNDANQIDNLLVEPGNSLSQWVLKHHCYLLFSFYNKLLSQKAFHRAVFQIECRKTKAKLNVITPANHKLQRHEPLKLWNPKTYKEMILCQWQGLLFLLPVLIDSLACLCPV